VVTDVSNNLYLETAQHEMNIIRPYISCHLKVITAIFIFSTLFSEYSAAQQSVSSLPLYNYHFDHLSFANGLLFNFVTSIIKDKQEFIRIATIDGLNRYDGITFKKTVKNNI
jgi:hypothetical protein